jgi:hypothetical protein
MTDFAPYSVARPPFPNLHVNMNGRIEQYVLSFTGANGTAVMLNTLSSAGCTVTYVSEGVYDFTFPAGGTGAIGWIQALPPLSSANTVAETRMYALDSDLVNFATGAGRLTAVDGSATPIVSDVIGTQTLLINVIKAVT